MRTVIYKVYSEEIILEDSLVLERDLIALKVKKIANPILSLSGDGISLWVLLINTGKAAIITLDIKLI